MDFEVELLARLQFALTVMFHYLFPPLTIGLGWLMVLSEGAYLVTKNKAYEQMARFWTKIAVRNGGPPSVTAAGSGESQAKARTPLNTNRQTFIDLILTSFFSMRVNPYPGKENFPELSYNPSSLLSI